MEPEQRLRDVAVVGAAGKMGRGIALLLAEHMLEQNVTPAPRLTLIDTQQSALPELEQYIETQAARRSARTGRPANVSSIIETTTDVQQAASARLVFEALPEVEALKVETLSQLRASCSQDSWFLSNTSSIPIGELDHKAGLDGRVIGFHFYNPPPVQKLLELIPAASTRPQLERAAGQLASALGKTVVTSHDTAGFIGNGHFIRECLYALGQMELLQQRVGFSNATYAVDKASRDGLVRPMGIFQVMDYAGIDICAAIMAVMDRYITNEPFSSVTAERMLSAGAKGGQHGDGSQKDGFFRYDGYRITAVYDIDSGAYQPLDEVAAGADEELGELALPGCSWKELRGQADIDEGIRHHFDWLGTKPSRGAHMALEYLQASQNIAEHLYADGIAACREDIDVVVTTGFHHLYGPLGTEVASR